LAKSLDGLAFAMRVNPANAANAAMTKPDPASAQQSAAETASAATVSTATVSTAATAPSLFAAELEALTGKSGAGEKAATSTTASDALQPFAASFPDASMGAALRPAADQPASFPSGGAASSVASEPPATPAIPSDPLRGVRVQLSGDGNQRVDLTLIERGGTLGVSVRSADGNLTRALQDHLPELSARLSEQRYQTEVWTPASVTPATAASETHSGSGAFESGGNKQGNAFSGSGSGGSGQNGSSQDGSPRQSPNGGQPDWRAQLAALGTTSQIRSEYSWVQ
jgi:hypothetical protein